MSIIHQALKRKERTAGDGTEVDLRSPGGATAVWQAPWFPGALAAAGVILAALLTYLVTRPGEITVIIPPPAASTAPLQATAAPTSANPVADPLQAGTPPPIEVPPGYAYQPAFAPATQGQTAMPPPAPASVTSGYATSPTGGVQPGAAPAYAPPAAPPAPAEPIASPNEFPHIPVYGGRYTTEPAGTAPPSSAPSPPQASPTAAPASDLPPNAVTIEMSEGRLESFSGGVSVNSSIPQPGAPLRVGTVVTTAPGAAASMGFERAQIDISGGSSARVSRLERRSDGEGGREEVTVHLSSGNARTVVRPGGGTVLVSTDQLTAAATSGAFQIQARADGAVTVQSEGGQVRLVPRGGADPITLSNGERVTWSNNAWVRE